MDLQNNSISGANVVASNTVTTNDLHVGGSVYLNSASFVYIDGVATSTYTLMNPSPVLDSGLEYRITTLEIDKTTLEAKVISLEKEPDKLKDVDSILSRIERLESWREA